MFLCGYQAPGTRGAAIEAGAESVKIHGEQVPVRAEVVSLESLAAHAGWRELLDWVARLDRPPRRTRCAGGSRRSSAGPPRCRSTGTRRTSGRDPRGRAKGAA